MALIEPQERAETELEQELTIAEAAHRTGLSAHTLRYYERAGLLLDVAREGSSGHRRYGEGDLEWIDLVTKLRSTGMPIRQIRRYAELVRSGPGNEAERLEMLEAHRAEVLAQIGTASAQPRADRLQDRPLSRRPGRRGRLSCFRRPLLRRRWSHAVASPPA